MKHLKIHSESGSNWYFRIGDLVERIYTIVRSWVKSTEDLSTVFPGFHESLNYSKIKSKKRNNNPPPQKKKPYRAVFCARGRICGVGADAMLSPWGLLRPGGRALRFPCCSVTCVMLLLWPCTDGTASFPKQPDRVRKAVASATAA